MKSGYSTCPVSDTSLKKENKLKDQEGLGVKRDLFLEKKSYVLMKSQLMVTTIASP
jgi:hypothetical protein